jgi:Mn2+/Fe2+ NRAMP family transporter
LARSAGSQIFKPLPVPDPLVDRPEGPIGDGVSTRNSTRLAGATRSAQEPFLPFILVTFAMSAVCQEMCMRVGAVTHRGYGQLMIERYGRVWGWFAAGDLVVTNIVTLIGELVAIRIGLAYFGIGRTVAALLGVFLVGVTLSGRRYWRWERAALGMAVFNGLFLVAGLLSHPNWDKIGHALVTFSPLAHGSLNTLLLLIASTIVATVTEWMIFFQQSASADKGLTPGDVRHGRYDTAAGAAVAALFGCGALTAGAALASHGPVSLDSLAGADFPKALDHALGGAVGTVFALGLIEAGAVAVLTISASTGYALAECLRVPHSMNDTARGGAVFYGANIGAAALAAGIVLIPGMPLLSIALNANVLATVLLPVSLVFMMMLASDRELMGEWANSRLTNRLAGVIVVFISVCGVAYAIDSFLEATDVV